VTAGLMTADCSKAELGELQMFKSLCLRESGNYAAALKHLEQVKNVVPDRVGWLEAKAECLIKMGKLPEASDCYLALLKLNPNCYEYFSQLQVCKKLPADLTRAEDPEQ